MHSTIPTFSMTGFLLPEQRGNLTPKCFLEMFFFEVLKFRGIGEREKCRYDFLRSGGLMTQNIQDTGT